MNAQMPSDSDLVAIVEHLHAGSTIPMALLDEFFHRRANEKEFVTALGGETNKHAFVEYLVSRLTAEPTRPDDRELALVVSILRILAREEIALAPMLHSNVLKFAIEISGLSSSTAIASTNNLQMEAVKLCVNILHHADEQLRRVALSGIENRAKILFQSLFETILASQVEALRFELPFYVSRTLFYCTVNPSNAMLLLTESPDINATLINIVDKSVTCVVSAIDTPFLVNFLVDCLKTLYSFSAHISDEPLRFQRIYTPNLKRMIFNLMSTFNNPETSGSIWKHTTHLLVNCSDDFLVEFLTQPSSHSTNNENNNTETKMCNGGNSDHKSVESAHTPANELILKLLVYSLTLESDDALHYELTPLLSIFTRAAKKCDPIKRLMKSWILDEEDVPEFVQEQVDNAVRNRLRRSPQQVEMQVMPTLKQVMLPLMCHYIYALKSYMGELFWVLCDEDTDTFVEAVGVEYGAGHLVEKGLLRPSDFARM